jgi:RNA polymerase sigma-70 factor (ECF subfamily)
LIDLQNISDEVLIKECLKDKRDFQEALYRKYANQMYSVVMIYTKDSDTAADILQEAFIHVFRKLDSFRFESPLGAWIRRIVVNKALEYYRSEKRKKEFIEDMGTQESPTIDGILDQINTKEIVRLVNDLPTKAAMILKLYAIEGYQHNEIASMLEISEGTSKSQLNRARALLKQKLIQLNG